MNNVILTDQEKEVFCYQTNVRVGDLNYGNHLAHDRLITIIHDARVCFLKAHHFSEINIDNTHSLMLTSLTIEYISQAFLSDILTIQIFLNEIKSSRFEMKYKISNQKGLLARCSTIFFCYNNQKSKLEKLPQSLLSMLKTANN